MLDNPKAYEKFDPANMYSLIYSFYEQFYTGRQIAETADYQLINPSGIKKIVVAGMGGSAIGADLLRCYSLYDLNRPLFVNRDYILPGFVDDKTLVILSSYSGNTEETLSSLEAARLLNAKLFAITSNGQIAELARELEFGLLEIPGELPPRAALGYSFVPLLTLFELWGFVRSQKKIIEKTAYVLQQGAKLLAKEQPTEENSAKKLATQIHGKLPLIYSSPRFEAVATRFRGQINENAKTLAYSAVIPEMNHNELVGWKHLIGLEKKVQPIFLIDYEDYNRNAFRMQFVQDVMSELGVTPIVLKPPVKDVPLMTRMFSLIQLGDFISYYMAILNEEDPEPVAIIDKLKSSLKTFAG